MELRTAALALALLPLGTALPAQDPATPPQPVQQGEPAQEQQQDPDRPSKTPAERIGELEDERAALQREIEFVRERVARSAELLRDKLKHRELKFRSIDAGRGAVSPVAATPGQTQRTATVMDAEQLAAHGEGVLLVAEGRPIFRAAFEQLVDYLGTTGNVPEGEARSQRAMLELVRIESTIGAFPEAASDAMAQAQQAAKEITDGADFVEVAKKHSSGPLVQDAKITITRNCPFGLLVEKAVFETAEGQRTPIVAGLTGYTMALVEKVSKGETPTRDTAECRILVVPYHPDPTVLDKARIRAATGEVSLQLADRGVIELLPPLLRPTRVLGVGESDGLDADKQDADRGDAGKQDADQGPVKAPAKVPVKAGSGK